MTKLERSIGQPTTYVLLTNIRSYTEFHLFIFDIVRVISWLVKPYVMDGGNEQRIPNKFCFKTRLSATETLVLVQKAQGNDVLNRSNVFRCILDFQTAGRQ
jgi:hypothetical protein